MHIASVDATLLSAEPPIARNASKVPGSDEQRGEGALLKGRVDASRT
jgi:hypothetical protein